MQYVGGITPVRVQGTVDDRPVLGESAGLVQAQHIHGAQIVQRREPLDDHSVRAGQQRRASGQTAGDDNRQHLRSQPDRHRDGERHRLQAAVAQRGVGHQHQRRSQQHEADQDPRDAVHRPVEGTRLALPGRTSVGGRELRVRSGRDDDRGGTAGGDAAALEAQLRLLEHPDAVRVEDVRGTLHDGRRFPVNAA